MPTTSPAEPPLADLLAQIDRDLARKDRTWKAALDFVGATYPAGWKEPEDEMDVRAMASWLPRPLAEKIHRNLQPRTKKAKPEGQQP